MRVCILMFGLFVMFSCKKETKKKVNKNCISKSIDAAFLEKYFVVSDSCETFNGYPKVKYFDNNNKLIMEGYSERYLKESEWRFFNEDNIKVVTGLFVNSEPKNVWKFKDIGDINWLVHEDLKNGYRFSYPKEWNEFTFQEGSMIGFSNSNDLKDQSLVITITAGNLSDLSTNFSTYCENMIDSFKSDDKILGFESKKIDMDDVDEVYEFRYHTAENKKQFISNELLFNYKGKVYVFSSTMSEKSNYDYSIIREVITTSFKILPNSEKQ